MGIRSRYPIALLILLLTSFEAYSATVRHVNVPPRAEVIRNMSYSFQTPYGEAAYYGQEFVDRHTAGNRFSAGDRMPPGGGSGGGSGGSVQVKLKPTVTVKPSTVASKAKGILKLNPAQLAGSAAVGLMLDAIDGVIRENQVMVPSVQVIPHPEPEHVHTRLNIAPASYPYRWDVSGHRFASPYEACSDLETWARENSTLKSALTVRLLSSNNFDCRSSNNIEWGAGRTYGTQCPDGYGYDSNLRACVKPDWAPASEEDFNTMESVAKGFDPGYLRDLIMSSCDGSPNPNGCYEELSSQGPLDGPATQTPPAMTTSTTTTNPDGTTTTTSTSTSNTYTYTYSPTSYTYTTTTTTTTTHPDGSQTVEETTDAQPVGEEPAYEEGPDPTFSDTDFPSVEPFYEQKYPDGLEGIWETRKAELLDSPFISFLESFVPSFSGSCPSFSLNINIASWANYGVQNFPSLCYVFDFIKVIMLVTAVFTARALMFGG